MLITATDQKRLYCKLYASNENDCLLMSHYPLLKQYFGKGQI